LLFWLFVVLCDPTEIIQLAELHMIDAELGPAVATFSSSVINSCCRVTEREAFAAAQLWQMSDATLLRHADNTVKL
jgi:hypothetical protein